MSVAFGCIADMVGPAAGFVPVENDPNVTGTRRYPYLKLDRSHSSDVLFFNLVGVLVLTG